MIDPGFQNHLGDIGFALNSIKETSFLGIFFFSIIVSYIVPLPEVVLLILIGHVAKNSGIDIFWSAIANILGTIVGDNFLFHLSLIGSKHVERFNRKMRANKLIQYEHLVADNIGKTIYFLRFVTGVRFFGPMISGTLGIKWSKFFIHNAGATIVNSILFIGLGYFYRHKIYFLIGEVEVIKNILLFSSFLIVGFLIRIFSKKK